MRTVAALYVDPRGPYPKMAGVDCWDESRNAKLYEGPHPVVAHPPCGPWGAMRHLNRKQVADCAPAALEQVRAFGGVLEHPFGSQLWKADETLREHHGRFSCHRDKFGGWCVAVDQVQWGHVARKRTWLYIVGVSRNAYGFAYWETVVDPHAQPTHWVSGGRNPNRKGSGGLVPLGIKVCSAQQRRRTPPAFAEFLVELARNSRKEP